MPAEIADLKSLGASAVLASDRVLDLTLAQINGFAHQDIVAYTKYETMSATTASDTLVGNAFPGSNVAGESILALSDGSYIVLYLHSVNGSGACLRRWCWPRPDP